MHLSLQYWPVSWIKGRAAGAASSPGGAWCWCSGGGGASRPPTSTGIWSRCCERQKIRIWCVGNKYIDRQKASWHAKEQAIKNQKRLKSKGTFKVTITIIGMKCSTNMDWALLPENMGAAGSSIVDEDYSYYCDEFYPEGYYYQDLNYEEEGKSLTNKCELPAASRSWCGSQQCMM